MQALVTHIQSNILLLSVLIFCIGTYIGLDLFEKIKVEYWILGLLLCSIALVLGKRSLHFINMMGPFGHNYITFNGIMAGSMYGIGVAVMHFAMQKDIKMEYNFSEIVVAAVISLIFANITFLLRLQKKFHAKEKVITALLMSIAVASLHSMEVHATTFKIAGESYMLQSQDNHIFPFDIRSIILLFISLLWLTFLLLRHQKRVEHKIRKQYYDSLFSRNPDFVCAINSKGNITEINKIGLKMISLKKDEIIGKHFTFLLANFYEGYNLLSQKIGEGLNGQFSHIETEVLCKNTEEKHFLEITTIPLILKKGHGVFIIAKDLTEKKNNQQMIRKIPLNLETELANQEGVIVKFVKNENQFIHTLCEGLLLKKLGLEKVDVLNKNLYDFLPQDVAIKTEAYYRHAWEGHEISYEMVFNDIKYYMSLKPIFVEEKVVEVIGSAIDITNLKHTQRQLEKNEQFYRSVIAAMSEGLVVIDKEGKVIAANESGAEILKVPYDTLKEFNIYSTDWSFIKEDFTRYKRNELPAIRTLEFLESTQNSLIGYKKENNQIIWLALNSQPLIQNNELKGAVITFTDMTNQKLHELKLIEINSMLKIAVKEAEEANKATSVFLSRMSHELRTPLNSILGYAQILMSKMEDPSAIRMVSKVYKAGNHLLDLINKILDFSVIEVGEVRLNCKEVDVNLIIYESLQIAEPLMMEEKIKLKVEIDETRPLFLSVDPVRFKQIILNLLTNAIKYNKVGGEIVVGSKILDEKFVQIFIRDTGIGIPESEFKVIFKPFKRLHKKNVEGTGIGLTLVEQLVTLQGGTFGVSSIEGEGSLFWVEFPIITQENE